MFMHLANGIYFEWQDLLALISHTTYLNDSVKDYNLEDDQFVKFGLMVVFSAVDYNISPD